MLHFLHMKLRWNWKRWPVAAAVLALAGANALAHEKWFIDEYAAHIPPPYIFTHATWFGAAVVLLAAAVMVCFWLYERKVKVARHPGFLTKYLEKAHVHARVVLCVTIGAMLMAAGLQGYFFSPNLLLPDTGYGHFLGLAQIAIGTLFVFLTPLAQELGVLLAAIFLAGLPAVPFADLMEEMMYLGVAAFLFTSETEAHPWTLWHDHERERLGYHAMRVMVGLNFLLLSTVKWFRTDLAMTLVERFHLDFLSTFGIDAAHFVFMAAVVETCIGLAILLKVAMRPAIVTAFIFFMLTIYFLGFRELLGHLPIKSTLFILFLIGDWKKGEKRIVR